MIAEQHTCPLSRGNGCGLGGVNGASLTGGDKLVSSYCKQAHYCYYYFYYAQIWL